jgi:hypothetical protein
MQERAPADLLRQAALDAIVVPALFIIRNIRVSQTEMLRSFPQFRSPDWRASLGIDTLMSEARSLTNFIGNGGDRGGVLGERVRHG